MIEHVVLFKFKPGTSDAQIDTLLDELRELPGMFDQMVELSCGRNISGEARNQGNQAGMRSLFRSKEGLAAYLPDPRHVSLVETYILPIADLITVLDWEVD